MKTRRYQSAVPETLEKKYYPSTGLYRQSNYLVILELVVVAVRLAEIEPVADTEPSAVRVAETDPVAELVATVVPVARDDSVA